jgi:trigger factor
MKSSFKKLAGSKMEVAVTLAPEDVKPYYDRAYENALRNVNLKGFRPGMAPKELAEGAVNKHAIMEKSLQEAVRHSLNSVVEENGWIVIDSPKVDISSDEKEVLTNKGIAYTAELTLYPDIVLPDYKKIARKVMGDKKEIAVTEKEIEESLNWLRKSRATQLRVARAATKGDAVEIDFRAVMDGKPLPGGEVAGDTFTLGEGKFIPGFEDNVAGHKEGEEIKFAVTAPTDYWQKDLQGKKLDFTVKLKGVFEMHLPEANDEFAKSLGKFADLADLRKNITDGLKTEKEHKEAERKRVKILEEIINGSKTDLPEVFIEKSLEGLMAEHKAMIDKSGDKLDDVKKNLRGVAEKRMIANLAISEIGKREHLEPSKEEIEEEAKVHRPEMKDMDAGKIYDQLYGILLNRKVFEFLEKQ